MQILFNGIISGLTIAMLAVAFQAVYLPTRVFFLGLAGVYATAPYVALAMLNGGWSWWLTGPTVVAVGIGICMTAETTIHRRLNSQRAGSGTHLIASLGMYIVLVQALAMLWGNDTKTLRMGLDSVHRIGGVIVTGVQLTTLIVSSIGLGGFLMFLMRTDLGLRLRALADNPTQFALFGYHVNRYRLLAFAAAGGLASLAGLTTAHDLGFTPHAGLHAILLAIVAVIVGGRATFAGPIVGGLLLGMLRSQVVWHWSARWAEPVSFGLLAITLLAFPRGMLGGRRRLEADE